MTCSINWHSTDKSGRDKSGPYRSLLYQSRILLRKRTELLIDFDKNDFGTRHAERCGKSGRANAGSEVDDTLSREHRTCRGEQDGIMADTVSGPRLP